MKNILVVSLPHETEQWRDIKNILNEEIECFQNFEKVVKKMKKLNGLESEISNLDTMEYVFGKYQSEVLDVLPFIAKMALRLEDVFQSKRLPFLVQGRNGVVSFSKLECLVLLANCFFSTFDRKSYLEKNDTFPSINFDTLYSMGKMEKFHLGKVNHARVAKIRMILNYFRRCQEKIPSDSEFVEFERIVRDPNFSIFEQSAQKLSKVKLFLNGGIETDYESLQADFANKIIGGGTLGGGGVQEEILFAISPECIVSRLVCEELNPMESIRIRNPEQFSTYKGYGNNLHFGGDFESKHSVDLAAIDSSRYGHKYVHLQFSIDAIHRDLWKAFVGFTSNEDSPKPIATGSWGSGVFNCDLTRGFIIQWLAASQTNREYRYYSFGKKEFTAAAQSFVKKWEGKTVGDLYQYLLQCTKFKIPPGKIVNCFDL